MTMWIKVLVLLCFIMGDLVASSSKKWTLSIAAIFQDDARFLKEWIEFHRLVGVEHFWLYNNASKDNYLEVLTPYIKRGIVELYDRPEIAPNLHDWNIIQCNTFMDAVKRARGKSTWVAFLDTDEYLFTTKDTSLVPFLKRFKHCGSLCVNWQGFGTSHVERIPANALLIELLTLRGAPQDEWNKHVKSIVNPEVTTGCSNPHFFFFKEKFGQVTSQFVPFEGPFSPTCDVSEIRINHYWTRDEEYLHHQKIPRGQHWGHPPEKVLRRAKRFNLIYDDAILRFVPALRQRMFP